jgi:uncharacterized protein
LIRAVVDTNVIVSGLIFRGLPLEVIRAAWRDRFTWVTSPVLIEETFRVLQSEKFHLSEVDFQSLTGRLFEKAEIILPQNEIRLITRRPQDNRVLECAVEGGCSLVVTGDRRDLLSLKCYRKIDIIAVREFLSRI